MNSNFKVKSEEELLLCCARTHMDKKTESKVRSLLYNNLDWNYTLKIASRHKLQPLLYWQLNQICSDDVPSEIMRNLKEFLKNNANKNLFFLKEIVEVVKLLNEHDIESVPYKGPILAQEVYGNLSMRQFADLDLFVKKDDVLKAKEILISKGYKPEFNLDSVQEQNYINSQRELKFSHELKGISLEIHWKFSGIFLNLPSNAEKIFLNDLNSLNIGGVPIPEISPENLILILSIHNASHQWSRLAWLVDVATLVNKKKIDWALVLNIAEQLSIQRILFINLYLCQLLLNLELDDKVSRFLKNESMAKASNMFVARFFTPESENSLIENMQISLKIRENKKDGLKDCLSGIFYPSFYELNHLKLPSFLFFLYYLYRPLNLLKRYEVFKK